jgi:hypothetical protein
MSEVTKIDQREVDLINELKWLEQQHAKLVHLKQSLVDHPDAFDSEDIAAVEVAISSRVSQIAKTKEEYNTQERLREKTRNVYNEMIGVISKRTRILETEEQQTQVLADNPDLCRLFAKKHVELTRLVHDV